MSDYIDRDAFIENERRIYCAACERRMGVRNGKAGMIYEIGDAPCRSCGIDDMLGELEDFPAADVAEVQHGHWETDKEGRKTCSACGAWCICMRKDGLWIDKAAYCPYCGAKMDESEDGKCMRNL